MLGRHVKGKLIKFNFLFVELRYIFEENYEWKFLYLAFRAAYPLPITDLPATHYTYALVINFINLIKTKYFTTCQNLEYLKKLLFIAESLKLVVIFCTLVKDLIVDFEIKWNSLFKMLIKMTITSIIGGSFYLIKTTKYNSITL